MYVRIYFAFLFSFVYMQMLLIKLFKSLFTFLSIFPHGFLFILFIQSHLASLCLFVFVQSNLFLCILILFVSSLIHFSNAK